MLLNGLQAAGLEPDVVPEPDGMIEFEFYEESRRVVSLSVDATPKVYWAAHNGVESTGHGRLSVPEAVEMLPQVIRETLGLKRS